MLATFAALAVIPRLQIDASFGSGYNAFVPAQAITAVSLDEYLHTSYQPDCEYEDGVVTERNAGELPHSYLQTLLAAYLMRRRKLWNITPLVEQRFRVREHKYMVPDVAVLSGPKPKERIITRPPLLWIEILSSEDRAIRVNRKVNDVLAFGTPLVWVIDPETLESAKGAAARRQ